ncbi:MAG: alcohol dehydrogenase family protein, partial [Pseudomonadota bacterium]
PKTMSGIWLTGHGDVDRLEARHDIPVPRPGPTDVLVQVAAAGVNNTDINTRTAWYSKGNQDGDDASWAGAPIVFPRIQGIDACGRIAAVGDAIDPSRIGERVLVEPCLLEADGQELAKPWFLGSECDGAFAEYLVVASRHACKIDSALSDIELASFPCSYSTAENMLTKSQVSGGDRVLVTGASGGVGSAAVQLAVARGAQVFAVTTPEKGPDLITLGAAQTLTRDDPVVEVLGADSLDVVVDLVAGPRWPELLDVLRPGGRYAVAGAVAGPLVELDIRTLYLKDLSFFGCTVLEPEVFANLIDLIETGRIAPVVAATFPLEEIAQAQALFQSKKHTGKIVLAVDAQARASLSETDG